MQPSAHLIDRRYSESAAEPVPWATAVARLADAQVAWIVTVRPDGRPHATPMVPVVLDGKVYFHTGPGEAKYANLRANPHVLVLVGDTDWRAGLDVAVSGTAVPITDDAVLRRVAERYRDRWDRRWELEVRDGVVSVDGPAGHPVPFEVTPDVVHAFAKGPFGQTTYRF